MRGELYNSLSLRQKFRFAVERGRGIHIETDLDPYTATLDRIRSIDFSNLSDREITEKALGYKESVRSGETTIELLSGAFALTAEAERRVLGIEPYDVQLVAAIVLSQGKLAQMKTGEGKTFTIPFAVTFSAWAGEGVHVLTANEYLARRDAAWMSGVYKLLGLSAAAVYEKMSPAERRAAYDADVTYLTAKQCGFDYLSDSLIYSEQDRIQRNFSSVIIDEADFILIDEARVPLVIASREEQPRVDPVRIDGVVRKLDPAADYTVDRRGRNCNLTLAGQYHVERLLGCGGMHEESSRDFYCAVHAGIHAHKLLSRDVDYIVRNGRIEQVDSFTGRIADKRRWPYGIQTALEAKEGLEIRNEGRIMGMITVQDLIGLYPDRAALTATAVSAARELYRSYGLGTVIIPPHRPDRTVHESDRVFTTFAAKYRAIVSEIETVHGTGRPILVGTVSVEESEYLASALQKAGIPCSVLNAKNDEKEASLIADAGMLHSVTISTNMAGRGTDIKLGGDNGVERDTILALGGLYVIGTTRHESVRVDNQLRGRAGRQGDPGLTRFFISLEDDIVRKYAIREFIPEEYLENTTEEEITDARVGKEIGRAQEIIESQHEVLRKMLRKYTELAEKERSTLRKIRDEALKEETFPQELLERCGDRIESLQPAFSLEPLIDILRRVLLASIDEFWADQLSLIDELREGIHLQWIGKLDPVLVFVKHADTAFVEGIERAIEKTADRFLELVPDRINKLPDMEQEKLLGPSSTWTYLLNDDPIPTFRISVLAGTSSGDAIMAGVQAAGLLPVVILRALIRLIAEFLEKKRVSVRRKDF